MCKPIDTPVDYDNYFQSREGSPLLDEIAGTLADRTGKELQEVVESIEEFGVNNFWDDFVGPMFDSAQDALF